MRGFKAFNSDLTCRDMQYEIGQTYEFDGEPIPCRQGFHFCKSIAECYDFYKKSEDTRICVVEATGDIATDDNKKYCTNKITVLEEITDEWNRKGNSNASSTGYCNTGNRNTGDCNTGDCNTGNCNTGDWNTGDCNTGNRNTGNRNTGNRNTGNRNTGDCNTGDCNTGDCNTGDCNTGNCNTGYCNTGNCNTGYCNTGNRNTGDWNTGDWNTGIFNTDTDTLRFFNKPSDWTYDQWLYSCARRILNRIENNVVEWVYESGMTDEEKEQHPTYKTTGGYLKVLDESDNAQIWWDSLSENDRNIIRSLPNFDEKIFSEIVGIEM